MLGIQPLKPARRRGASNPPADRERVRRELRSASGNGAATSAPHRKGTRRPEPVTDGIAERRGGRTSPSVA